MANTSRVVGISALPASSATGPQGTAGHVWGICSCHYSEGVLGIDLVGERAVPHPAHLERPHRENLEA